MKNTKYSITFKVLAGYLLLAVFAVSSVWLIYGRVTSLIDANQDGNPNNQKLLLISKAVAKLYKAEGISHNIIQNQRPEDLPKYNVQIDTIGILINSLKKTYQVASVKKELDSISQLLSQKVKNLSELLYLRKNSKENYYDRALDRLRKKNPLFEDEDYGKKLKKLEPYQRKVVKDFLDYIKKDNAQTLTQQTADSLVNSMKEVLGTLEIEVKQHQKNILAKENELLENDRMLSSQLRNIRSEIEQEEIQKSMTQVSKSRKIIQETSEIMGLLGVACVIIIIIFVVLIIRDTNRSQRYRDALEKSKAYAEFLLQQREQLMATVTHDLRSPLNSILGYSGLMDKTDLTAKQDHYLEQLKKSSEYILHLVNDLLDFSKLESGKAQVEKLPFNPKKIIQDSLAGSIPSENPKNLKIILSIDDDLDRQFLSDPFRIQQILTNLLGNAYKFTSTGAININATLDTSAIESNKLKIEITDSGIGIEKDQQKQIFEEFSQAKTSIEKKYGGTGLGLAITKKLTELLGGKITLESTLGKGSTFKVILPVENAKQTFSSQVQKQIHIENPREKRLLIVDDETTQLALTSEIVKQAGFSFDTAQNAKIALEKIKQEKFDLILSDIQMPEMDGFELLRQIKKNKKNRATPVVALSGRTELSQKIYAKEGFETNLIKPFHANELLKAVARILKLDYEVLTKKEQEEYTVIEKSDALYSLRELKIFTDGDNDSLKTVLKTFVDNTEENLVALMEAESEKDNEKIAFIAHKMLPMLRQLHAKNSILSLEKLEKQNHYQLQETEISRLVAKTNLALKELLEQLKERFSF